LSVELRWGPLGELSGYRVPPDPLARLRGRFTAGKRRDRKEVDAASF